MASLLPRPINLEGIVGALYRAFDLIENFERWRIIGGVDEIAFQNSWANEGSGEDAAFRKNIIGQVEVRGILTSPGGAGTGNGTVAFTLPKGYRPSKNDLRFTVVGFSGLAAPVVGEALVQGNGNVTITLSGVAGNAVVGRVNCQIIFKP